MQELLQHKLWRSLHLSLRFIPIFTSRGQSSSLCQQWMTSTTDDQKQLLWKRVFPKAAEQKPETLCYKDQNQVRKLTYVSLWKCCHSNTLPLLHWILLYDMKVPIFFESIMKVLVDLFSCDCRVNCWIVFSRNLESFKDISAGKFLCKWWLKTHWHLTLLLGYTD